jgi:hypothetical protein
MITSSSQLPLTKSHHTIKLPALSCFVFSLIKYPNEESIAATCPVYACGQNLFKEKKYYNASH